MVKAQNFDARQQEISGVNFASHSETFCTYVNVCIGARGTNRLRLYVCPAILSVTVGLCNQASNKTDVKVLNVILPFTSKPAVLTYHIALIIGSDSIWQFGLALHFTEIEFGDFYNVHL